MWGCCVTAASPPGQAVVLACNLLVLNQTSGPIASQNAHEAVQRCPDPQALEGPRREIGAHPSHARAGDSRNRMAEAFVALMRLARQTDRITNACIILGERWQGLTWLCRELKVC